MIRPGVPAPNLAARLGREVVRERSGVEYRELRARSLVNRCASPRVPFEWTVNPYRGCAMGCRYCYAAYTHEYLGLEAAGSFHSTIYAKSFAEDETLRALTASARRGERVALGTATDPYQPGESELRVTRRFLECAAQVRGLRLGITTKGASSIREDIQLKPRGDGGADSELEGIGAILAPTPQGIVVTSLVESGPAAKAGVERGDRILRIDGVSAAEMTLSDAIQRLRGPEGSRVSISLAREGSATLEVTVRRERIER